MLTLTKTEIRILKGVIETELKMIGFLKGFVKNKKPYETILEKILKKLEENK